MIGPISSQSTIDIDLSQKMERQNSLSKITPPGTYHDYYLYKNHSKRLGFLLDNPIFSDVTIIIEKDDSIKKFMCHKAILASHSEPFRAMYVKEYKMADNK